MSVDHIAPAESRVRNGGPRTRRLTWETIQKVALPLIVLVALGFFWQGMIRLLNVPDYVAPPPTTIASALARNASQVTSNLETTALEAAIGLLIGTSVAFLLALAFLFVRPLRIGLMPIAIGFSTVPIVAVAPILVLLLGEGLLSKVVMTSMICFFPTLMNLGRGLDEIDPETRDLFRVFNANRRQVLIKLRLLTARPYFFAALRVTAGSAVIGAIIAEWVNGERGLGYMIIQETFNYDTVLLWGYIVVSILVATAFFLVVVLFERIAYRYVVD